MAILLQVYAWLLSRLQRFICLFFTGVTSTVICSRVQSCSEKWLEYSVPLSWALPAQEKAPSPRELRALLVYNICPAVTFYERTLMLEPVSIGYNRWNWFDQPFSSIAICTSFRDIRLSLKTQFCAGKLPFDHIAIMCLLAWKFM